MIRVAQGEGGHEMLIDEMDRRDGRPDPTGAEDPGRGELGGDCCGDGADWLSDLEAKQRDYDDHCCFELDKRLEREIREGSIE
jgi:hypothetical protein